MLALLSLAALLTALLFLTRNRSRWSARTANLLASGVTAGILVVGFGSDVVAQTISDARELHKLLATLGILTGSGDQVGYKTSGVCLKTGGTGCKLTGDLLFDNGNSGGADITVDQAASATAGDTLDLVAGQGGTAATNADGKAGGAVTIVGGAGTALNGTGTNDGSGGDVALTGGARGGANGSAVAGIVRVGSPTVGSTKAVDLLACGGGFEVDGASQFDGNVTFGNASTDTVSFTSILATDLVFNDGISGGADISVEAAAADTAGTTLDLVSGAGGTPSTNQVGKNGAILSITGGAGSAKNGSGANDGDGGDVVLLGGAKGGSTASTEVDGIVRVGSPTVGSTKATNVLAVGGAFEVDGASKFDGNVTLGDAAADATLVTGSFRTADSAPNGDTTLTTASCGVTQYIGAAGDDFTLPSPTAGCVIRFIVDANFATTAMTIVTASSANVIFGAVDVNSSLVACADEDTITIVETAELKGDFVELRSDGTNWYVFGMGVTTGSITCTQAS